MRGMGRGEEGLTLSQERCSGNLSLRHVFVAVFSDMTVYIVHYHSINFNQELPLRFFLSFLMSFLHQLWLNYSCRLVTLFLTPSSYFRSCISASDPYCAWNKETRRCVSVLSSRSVTSIIKKKYVNKFSSGLCNNPKLFSNLPSGGEPRVLQSEIMRTSSQTSEVHSGSKWIRCDILKSFAFF